MVTVADIRRIVENEAAREHLDPKLLMAIIKVESNFNPNASRYEKQFVNYWKAEEYAKIQHITKDTETQFQKFSWGLMQIMGGTARWCGYPGFLPGLCDPEVNVIYGCEFFKKVCSKYVYLTDQIASYNRGSVKKDPSGKYVNQEYVDRVLAAMGSSLLQ